MAKIDLPKLKEAARGRWPAILQAAGIHTEYLHAKHGPCPVCGGKDRFRFTDKDGRGGHICNQHCPEGGDGFRLLMDYRQCDFISAARFVVDVLGGAAVVAMAPDATAIAAREAMAERERQQAWAKAGTENATVWQICQPVTPDSSVGQYLRNRGIDPGVYPDTLRQHPALPYWDNPTGTRPVKLGEFVAQVAAIQAPDGHMIALHKTYLTHDGHKAAVPSPKKWSAKSGDHHGAAIRLFAAAPAMAVTEGIETALAVHLANQLPVWAGISANGLAGLWLPESAREIYIFADHDENQAGQRAADQLARRLLDAGKTVRLLYPRQAGQDWLDVFTSKG